MEFFQTGIKFQQLKFPGNVFDNSLLQFIRVRNPGLLGDSRTVALHDMGQSKMNSGKGFRGNFPHPQRIFDLGCRFWRNKAIQALHTRVTPHPIADDERLG